MRKLINILIIAFPLLLSLSGCLVRSVNPFYTDAARWRIYKNEMLEQKITQYTHWMPIDENGNDKYEAPWKIETPWSINGKYISVPKEEWHQIFVTYFIVKKTLFLDAQLIHCTTDGTSLLPLETHSLYKVSLTGDIFELIPLKRDWFIKNARKKKLALSNTTYIYGSVDEILLTAKSDQLVKFLEKYGANPDIYDDRAAMKFKGLIINESQSNKAIERDRE